MDYVLAIFKFFLGALRSIKNYVNPFSLCILTFWPYGINDGYIDAIMRNFITNEATNKRQST